MLAMLAHNWWMFAVRGLIAVIVGLAALFMPGITLEALVLLFGAYVLADGIFALVAAIANRVAEPRRWVLLEGIAGIIAGVLALVWPGITAIVLLHLIAGWSLITGIFEILAAIELSMEIEGEWSLLLSGLVSLIFGVILLLNPETGALAIVWLTGLYAIVFGIFLLMVAFRLRAVHQRLTNKITQGI